MRCGYPVPPCFRGHPTGKGRKGQAMVCACKNGPTTHAGRFVCKCEEGEQSRSHFHCCYALQLRILGPDFATAELWEGSLNANTHQSAAGEPLQQIRRKVPEDIRNDASVARIQDRTTPTQYLACASLLPLRL
jgi:hypothetical protein